MICVSTGETVTGTSQESSHIAASSAQRARPVTLRAELSHLERRETYITLLLDAGPASIIGSSGKSSALLLGRKQQRLE